MIPSRHTEPVNTLLGWYVRRKMRRQFGEIRIHADGPAPEHSVLLIGNHFSWWDGFFALEANDRFFRKRMHVMMLEEQLRSRRFLRLAGAFSIAPGQRSALKSLGFASALLRRVGQLVVVFPQGELSSLYRQPLIFQKGWHRLVGDTTNEKGLWFMVTLPAYGSLPKAGIDIFLQPAAAQDRVDADAVERGFNRFLQECIEKSVPS